MQLHKMNLSSGLKLFWQAIPEPAKVLEVGKAFPLLGSSASQQVQGLNSRLSSKPLTGLKGRAVRFSGSPRYHSQRTGRCGLFIGSCGASGTTVHQPNVTLSLDAYACLLTMSLSSSPFISATAISFTHAATLMHILLVLSISITLHFCVYLTAPHLFSFYPTLN